jgi:hypothetical protein
LSSNNSTKPKAQANYAPLSVMELSDILVLFQMPFFRINGLWGQPSN